MKKITEQEERIQKALGTSLWHTFRLGLVKFVDSYDDSIQWRRDTKEVYKPTLENKAEKISKSVDYTVQRVDALDAAERAIELFNSCSLHKIHGWKLESIWLQHSRNTSE